MLLDPTNLPAIGMAWCALSVLLAFGVAVVERERAARRARSPVAVRVADRSARCPRRP